MSVNKVFLLGRLGQDPESKMLQSGTSVTNFSMATSKKWKDNTGKTQEKTEWHRVVCFAATADVAAKYLKKGSQVHVEGEIQYRSYDGTDGQKRYVTEILCNQINLVDPAPSSRPGGVAEQASVDTYDGDVPF